MDKKQRSMATRLVMALACVSVIGGPAFAAGGAVAGTVEVTPPKYREETIVYVKEVPGTFPPKTVDLDQKGMQFIPHVLAITVNDTVRFLNHDTVAHNVFTPDGDKYNLGTFAPGQTRDHKFTKAGVYTQLCSIHPEMLAFIFVGQNRYSAAVDKSGKFKIEGIPPGTYQLAVWSSHGKAPDQSVTITAGKTAEASFTVKK